MAGTLLRHPGCAFFGILAQLYPQKALCGGIPGSFLEPLARSWSHFVGTYCQKLTNSVQN